MRYLFALLAPLVCVSCISQVQVDFNTDATVHSSDIGILKQQDYMLLGRKPDMYVEYRGPVNYVPVGKGLRGSAGHFTFRHDACTEKHQVSYTYAEPDGTQRCQTIEMVPEQVEEVIFSRVHGILIRPVDGSALLHPRAEARMCTD